MYNVYVSTCQLGYSNEQIANIREVNQRRTDPQCKAVVPYVYNKQTQIISMNYSKMNIQKDLDKMN
jgi:hypothetical protein